ncbi:MAG: hypothetical protein ACTSQF_08940 [Candidatus Heimdallarchaeaceae archaeon]
MSSEKKPKQDITETILYCSTLISDTLIRMADLTTLSLLYHPGMEDRVEKMEHLYQNVVNFVDDITSTIYQPIDSFEISINQYDPIFTHLKQVAKLMAELVSLISQEHIKMQLQTLEYFYNLNKAILECINVYSHLVHANSATIQAFDKTKITSIEIGAHQIYRMLLQELPAEKTDWKQIFIFYLVGEKMNSIVFHSCEACKKIYAVKFRTLM